MRPETRRKREDEIEEAAYRLLTERGYAGMSMLAVARSARASNETLYRWYGDKLGLFKALVTRNANRVRTIVENGLAANRPPLETIRTFGPCLLELLTGPRAVALNRAAAADPSGELGIAIAEHGRETIMPLLTGVIARAQANGHLTGASPDRVSETYVRLLIGDLQIRRVIGALDAPGDRDLKQRAEEAFSMLGRLFEGRD